MSPHYQRREFLKLATTAVGSIAQWDREPGAHWIRRRRAPRCRAAEDPPRRARGRSTRDMRYQRRALKNAQDIVEKKGRKRPEGYSRGAEDYRRLAAREDLDAVMTATPWELHTPVAVAAMKAGIRCYRGSGGNHHRRMLGAGEYVRANGMPCMMLENDCFGRGALMALNLVSKECWASWSTAKAGTTMISVPGCCETASFHGGPARYGAMRTSIRLIRSAR